MAIIELIFAVVGFWTVVSLAIGAVYVLRRDAYARAQATDVTANAAAVQRQVVS